MKLLEYCVFLRSLYAVRGIKRTRKEPGSPGGKGLRMMYTLLIICVVVGVVGCLFLNFDFPNVKEYIAIGVMSVCVFLSFVSAVVSAKLPEGYQKIESYSYVTETGAVEQCGGPYYKKNDIYYKQKMGKACWIPFYPCEYVEATLPGNATPSENSVENETD